MVRAKCEDGIKYEYDEDNRKHLFELLLYAGH